MDLVILPTLCVSPHAITDELKREETASPLEPKNTSNEWLTWRHSLPAIYLFNSVGESREDHGGMGAAKA